MTAFATASGMSRQQLYRYLGGEALDPEGRVIDLAYMPQDRAEGLITAMGLTDWEAWEVLGIPDDAKTTFRTFRPFPEGHGRKVSEVIEIRLSAPMVGEIPLPAGTLVRIDPNVTDGKMQVIRLEDGRLYSVNALMLERAGGEHLGTLLSAHF
ncbi:hypothetical protein [Deinococcus sp. QL22]|uniref:hypothetical protein n=1 Tax=Deinococcus sp. QL22 TaxID=2939437 RepID=UPI0020174C0B|nr:hypothetical protein [Deinococcus sp. QL22]UQN10289.1 hypothetical protein M1R55_29500 [Deinococcus sp. QL22]UQN10423.1 hypothetical protein M1R55_28825 [Deinococcus sp. QL22]